MENLVLNISLLNGTTDEIKLTSKARSLSIEEFLNDSIVLNNSEKIIDIDALDTTDILIVEATYNVTDSIAGVSQGEDAPFSLKKTIGSNPEILYPKLKGIAVIQLGENISSLKILTDSTVDVRIKYYIGSYAI
jgi:hypothetical protein